MKKSTRTDLPARPPKRPGRQKARPHDVGAPSPEPAAQRLHKVLALAGLGSRREMEALIGAGRITVNNKLATLGMSVAPTDVIRLDRRIVRLPEAGRLPRVLLYHKPEGEIVSRDDPQQRASVFEKLPRIRGAKWVAIGRLDFNTCGLLVFTTSGELANRLTHPRYEVEREYAVRILGGLTEGQMLQLTEGVELEDGVARFDAIEDRGGEGANHWYQVMLHEGRNREVRRLFEALGLQVSRLLRVRFGPLSLPSRLKRGQLLELSPAEVRDLLQWAGLPLPALPQRQQSPREREQSGKAFTPKTRAGRNAAKDVIARPTGPRRSRVGMQEIATGPSPLATKRPDKPRAGSHAAGADAQRGFNPATRQRRSDRNRNRG